MKTFVIRLINHFFLFKIYTCYIHNNNTIFHAGIIKLVQINFYFWSFYVFQWTQLQLLEELHGGYNMHTFLINDVVRHQMLFNTEWMPRFFQLFYLCFNYTIFHVYGMFHILWSKWIMLYNIFDDFSNLFDNFIISRSQNIPGPYLNVWQRAFLILTISKGFTIQRPLQTAK